MAAAFSSAVCARKRTNINGVNFFDGFHRAVVPRIDLQSPKFTRKLTTEWFANLVDERQRRCMARIGAPRDL